MKKVNLGQIAKVLTGYPFRSSLRNVLGNEIRVIQAKDIKAGITIDTDNLVMIENQDFYERFFIRRSDVLLSARGALHATAVNFDLSNVIASLSLYIIRLTINQVKPEYLAIYLNSLKGQKLLSEKSTGAAITTILRRDLEEIEIVIPSPEDQRQIIEIYENNQRQQKLLKQKAFLTSRISQGLINQLLNI